MYGSSTYGGGYGSSYGGGYGSNYGGYGSGAMTPYGSRYGGMGGGYGSGMGMGMGGMGPMGPPGELSSTCASTCVHARVHLERAWHPPDMLMQSTLNFPSLADLQLCIVIKTTYSCAGWFTPQEE